ASCFASLGGDAALAAVVRPTPDLDGDGVADLLCSGSNRAAVLALSGKTGEPLWSHAPEVAADQLATPGRVADEPLVVDCDADGPPDVVALFICSEKPVAKRSLRALSGKSGKVLWSVVLPDAWFAGAEADAPELLGMPFDPFASADDVRAVNGRHAPTLVH